MGISFSWRALVIIILAMLPNIIYFISPPTDIPQSLGGRVKLIEMLESGSRIISFVALLFLAKRPDASFISPWMIGIVIFLLLYFILWGRYFYGGSTYSLLGKSFLGIPMPMVIFPVLYFICAAFWLECIPAVLLLLAFGVFHAISLL